MHHTSVTNRGSQRKIVPVIVPPLQLSGRSDQHSPEAVPGFNGGAVAGIPQTQPPLTTSNLLGKTPRQRIEESDTHSRAINATGGNGAGRVGLVAASATARPPTIPSTKASGVPRLALLGAIPTSQASSSAAVVATTMKPAAAGGSDWAITRAPALVVDRPEQMADLSWRIADEYGRSHLSRIKLLSTALKAKGGLDPLSHWPNITPLQTNNMNSSVACGRAPLCLELDGFLKRELYSLGLTTTGTASASSANEANRPPIKNRDAMMDGPSNRLVVASTSTSLAVAMPAAEPNRPSDRSSFQRLQAGERPQPTTLEQAPVYREVISCLANHFQEYNTLFSKLLRFFDVVTGELRFVYKAHHDLRTDYDSLRDRFHALVHQERDQHASEVDRLHDALGDVKTSLHKGNTREMQLKDEVQRLTNQIATMKAELDDSTGRSSLFEKCIHELGERGVVLTKRCHKLKQENESLHHMVQYLEGKLKTAEFDVMVEQATKTNRTGRRASLKQRVAKLKATVVDAIAGTHHGDTSSPPHASADGGTASLEASVRGGPDVARSLMRAQSFVHDASLRGGVTMLDEDLPGDIEELHNHVVDLEAKLKRVTRANFVLQQDNRNLVQRIEGLVANIEREQQDMTPRPMWELVATAMPDFPMSELSTSCEILEELVMYLREQKENDRREVERKAISNTVRQWLGEEDACESDLTAGRNKTFVCKGTGLHVPLYLRSRGVVRNRKMRKGDVEKILSKFWTSRRMHLRTESSLNAQALPEFLLAFLTSFTGSHRAAIELAYNVFAVCEANHHDPDCGMMLRIFKNELSEFAIYDQIDMLTSLEEAIREQDKTSKGCVSRFAVHRVLSKLFPAKSRHDMMRLRFALILTSKGSSMVDHHVLFNEDDEGNQSRFVTLLRAQHVDEVTSFTVEVEETLRDVIRDGMIDVNEARIAMKRLDTDMPNVKIEEIVAFGCGLTTEQLDEKGQYLKTTAETFLTRLRSGILLRRHGRKLTDTGDEDADYDNPEELDIAQLDELEQQEERDVAAANDAAGEAPNSSDASQLGINAALKLQAGAGFGDAMTSLVKTQKQAMENQRKNLRRKKASDLMSQIGNPTADGEKALADAMASPVAEALQPAASSPALAS